MNIKNKLSDIQILKLVVLALDDPGMKRTQESLIELTKQYGGCYGITESLIKEILNKKLIDFL